MKINNIFKFIISVSLPLVAGFVGSVFTTPAITTWYAELTKPALNPPNWIFGPVWTILYILMGISFFLVWREYQSYVSGRKEKMIWRWGVILFILQLVLNVFWSVIFFGIKSPGWALGEIVILWLVILLTIIVFSKISKLAAWLLVPYLLWVSFATYLNYSIWMLN